MPQLQSAGLQELLRTDPENGGTYRARYNSALTLVETRSITELRESSNLLKREYSSWKNAKHRAKGLHPAISDFKEFIRVHGPMPDDGEWSLDRINPLGPYSPPNIRWLDPLGQTRNRTNTLILNFYDKQIYLKDAALVLNMSYGSVYKMFSRNPKELFSLLEKESYAMQYDFPDEFKEELEASYANNVHNLMRLDWILEYAYIEMMRFAGEIEDTPHDYLLKEQHRNAVSVYRHAYAFKQWAHEQRRKKISHALDVRTAGPLPDWELETLQFTPTPPPEYSYPIGN
ncbi:hypothetical protein HS961_20715 [Comamonas piscis]|uniref:Uncharacterized protein n=1 Tax=Comamonas piscis TaxID=1562974 RepID=A0A7G5EM44_9BURK|nr:hypothetical protein [Comamonas piscis]QMV75069.1 hypothetical protein HS961_20715 [Comamonas piscis]WSO33553.1 hypothetical protein VUJ63_20780 [Comamonas piscis]